MPSEEFISAASFSADHRQRSAEQARVRLAIMGELHTSLLASCEALLALDLAGIMRGTREQVGLSAQLAREMGQETQCAVQDKPPAQNQPAPYFAAGSSALNAKKRAEITEELKQSQDRLWQALRLQSAILARARAKLRVLANAVAGPSVNYGPPPVHSGARRHAPDCRRGGEI